MESNLGRQSSHIVPWRRKKHYSFAEDLDEPMKLMEDEPVEIEKEAPSEENESVEGVEENNKSVSPAFEE